MVAGNLNNLDVVEVTGPGEFRFWRRDARGAWTDGGTGEGDAAAIAAWREDLLVFFDTGRYAQFGLKETRVWPSPVPAWTPAAACEDGLAAEAFGWNASGEPILARDDGGKWTWQRVEADLVRDRARDVRLVHFAGRPYLVWREEAEPLLEKTAPTAWRVRFIYKEGGRWQPVTSRLAIASAPLVASDGQRLIFLYQKPGEGAAWTLASYLVSDEDWHETGAVSGTVPAGPVALARQGSQFFLVVLADGEPQVAPLDPTTGRRGPLRRRPSRRRLCPTRSSRATWRWCWRWRWWRWPCWRSGGGRALPALPGRRPRRFRRGSRRRRWCGGPSHALSIISSSACCGWAAWRSSRLISGLT